MKQRTLIIAEAGVNHNGDMALARQLIDAAADSGADLVKFQTFSAARLVTQSASKADYQMDGGAQGESQFDMLRRLELSPAMHDELIAHCATRGIGFFSTAFDLDSIDLLAGLGQTYFKVPSGELTNLPYLRRIAAHGGQVILSTGMATMGDIEAAIAVMTEAGSTREDITVLHCTTEYPTPMEEVNLRAMQSIGSAFQVAVGYSDHTRGIEIPIAAVAMGASVIEKHFTLDRTLPGPDHKASLEPDELRAMVAAIRNVDIALGDGVKRLTPSEAKNRPVARKSLVALRAIAAGEAFGADNMTAKRPGTGISPMRWDEVAGRRAARAFAADELIEL